MAQNFVDNPTDFPPELQADARCQERLKRELPLGRLGGASSVPVVASVTRCSHPAREPGVRRRARRYRASMCRHTCSVACRLPASSTP